jgi:hypothetical protein
MRVGSGNVFEYLGGIVAALIIGIDVYWWAISGNARSDQVGMFVAFIIVAFIAWFLGRMCRHVFDNFTHST